MQSIKMIGALFQNQPIALLCLSQKAVPVAVECVRERTDDVLPPLGSRPRGRGDRTVRSHGSEFLDVCVGKDQQNRFNEALTFWTRRRLERAEAEIFCDGTSERCGSRGYRRRASNQDDCATGYEQFSTLGVCLSENFGSRAFHNAKLQKKKKQAEALLPGAIAAYQRGEYGEAKMLCRRILRDRPDHFDALHLLGVLELDGPRVDDAEKFLQRAVKVQPRSAEAHSNLGLAWAKLKRFEEARKCQETAIALNPNSPTALTNLGNVLMRLRRYELAVEAHERAIRLKPDYADAYNNRGMALLLLGRHATADASFDRALSLQPRHLAALVGKAMVSMCLRHLDAAQRALDAASAINPHVPEALVHRGRLKMVLGKFDEAEADFDAALAIDPALESAWESKAHHGLLTTKIAQAIHACHKVLESNPDSEVAIGFLGSCHAAQGDMATALQLFDRALVLRPDFDDVMLKKIFVMDY
ncbi:MAG: tetratricopeptide repeat protein, partial [Bradyrhizobium sp.]